jgi:hypothetical protein
MPRRRPAIRRREDVFVKTLFPLAVSVHSPVDGDGAQPLTIGVPFPRGSLRDVDVLVLGDGRGRSHPVQSTALARWPDGSVKWLLVEAVVDQLLRGRSNWELARAGDGEPPGALRVEATPRDITVDTGRAVFVLSEGGPLPLGAARSGSRELLDPAATSIELVDADGTEHLARAERWEIEAAGPLRATARIDGRFTDRSPQRFVLRCCFFAGTGLVRLRLTLHNPRRARHASGLWDLGDQGSVLFRELAVQVGLRSSRPLDLAWSPEPDRPLQSCAADGFEIHQHSSGGEHWNSRNHVNRDGRVLLASRGYRARVVGEELQGLRANPVIGLRGDAFTVGFTMPEFWQQFPKALAVDGGRVRFGVFPRQASGLHELQGGEQKTHTLWIDFGGNASGLSWVHRPARVHLDRAWYAASGALPWLTEEASPAEERLDELLVEALDETSGLAARREIVDEYGWRHYGDLWADHEGLHFDGVPPVMSHYNNQYDVVWGMLLQYFRTGDPRWYELLDPLARHVIDVDIYHTTEDRAAYNGGLFWHTDHYRDAATSTHRAFSRANVSAGEPYGGGPCNEHNYTTGLLHYYYLTGDLQARDAVRSLADWVPAMDDGRRHALGALDHGPTGLATATGEPGYHGPGRGAANSIGALLDALELTGDVEYLAQAERFIRRCVHPHDDVPRRRLLEVERRWSYTVFLVTLARYLEAKRVRGENDDMFAYARASLVRYATWMVEHELPYFDQREKLVYPTETWAAQELRKANVLRLAARLVDEPARSRMFDRGQELAERAWSDLRRFTTRASTRSLAICMREGPCDAWLRSSPGESFPLAPRHDDFGQPEPFEPQKARVQRRLRTAGGLSRAIVRLANPRSVARLWTALRE